MIVLEQPGPLVKQDFVYDESTSKITEKDGMFVFDWVTENGTDYVFAVLPYESDTQKWIMKIIE